MMITTISWNFGSTHNVRCPFRSLPRIAAAAFAVRSPVVHHTPPGQHHDWRTQKKWPLGNGHFTGLNYRFWSGEFPALARFEAS
jgi:hypothetical protein